MTTKSKSTTKAVTPAKSATKGTTPAKSAKSATKNGTTAKAMPSKRTTAKATPTRTSRMTDEQLVAAITKTIRADKTMATSWTKCLRAMRAAKTASGGHVRFRTLHEQVVAKLA